MKTIAYILGKIGPQANTVEVGTKMIDALAMMKAEGTTFVIITKNGEYAGIVTERDYAQKVILMGRSSHLTNVEEIMSCNLPTVSSTDPIEKCMMMMNAYKSRYLPVFDDFQFKCVITMNDIIAVNFAGKENQDIFKYSSDKVF